MKKKFIFIIAVIIIITLSMLEINISFKGAQAQQSLRSVRSESFDMVTVRTWTERMDGMTYRIFTFDNNFQVINVTKEQLEVEKLKLQIKNLK